MTIEVAEKIVRGITDKIECNTADIDDWAEFWGFTKEEYEEFLDMALELEQESFMAKPCISSKVCEHDRMVTLDKIRAEIKAMSGDIETIADVLAILDKYKAESEETDI